MKFSIIIPLKEFNNYLKESIPYIFKLDYPRDKYEVIILPNEIPKYIPKYLQDKRITIFPTGKVSPAIKRDIGVNRAKGDVVVFIDDDSYPREDWLIAAEKTYKNLPEDFAVINGPAITPPNSTIIENMSGAFFESSLGAGATYRCRDKGKSFSIKDAPSVNLFAKKKAFLDVKGFGSEYWPGEDSIFCQKIQDKGYKIWHQNNLIVFHHRRDTIKHHLKQVAGYGKHRGNFFRKGIGCSRKITYIIPSLFLVGNLITFLLFPKIWMCSFFIYIIIISFSLCSCVNLPLRYIFQTAFLTFVSHLTYGFNFLKGFFTKDIKSRLR